MARKVVDFESIFWLGEHQGGVVGCHHQLLFVAGAVAALFVCNSNIAYFGPSSRRL